MQHLEPDAIALAAVGDTMDPATTVHLASCRQCSEEVAELRDVVSMVRSSSDDSLEQPSPAVWEAISRELGLAGVDGGTPETRRSVPDGSSPRSRRRFAGGWIAAAAAVGFLAGAGALWGIEVVSGDGAVVARTELSALAGYAGSGEATIVQTDDGARTVDVSVDGQPADGYNEVWLISSDLQSMYSVGLLDGDQGSFAVPADLDLAQFPIVDVSDEPYDGDPVHSGVSTIRGTVSFPGS